MTMTPDRLSRELRLGRGGHLRRRRWIVGLSYVGATAAMAVGLYQMGIVRRLPSLPVGPFDASMVDASDYAYARMRTPDAMMMLVTYGATALLAGAGGKDRARDTPWVPLALAAKTLYDAVTTLRLTREEWAENEALCDYCQAATLASLASAVLALPEAGEALRTIRARMASDGPQRLPPAPAPEDGPTRRWQRTTTDSERSTAPTMASKRRSPTASHA